MKQEMDCRRAEELLSDHLEGTLSAPLSADLEAHLGRCATCRELRAAVTEVMEALAAYPDLEPPVGLAERAAAAALARPRRTSRVSVRWPDFGLPAGLQVLAAVLALAVTGVVLLAALQGSRIKERTVVAAVYLSERKDRLIEDFRLLQVVVTTAFEGRLDRMNDRVDDYKRLLERRRATEQDQKRTGPPESDASSIRSAQRADSPRNFILSNQRYSNVVTACERAGHERPGA
jgi:hypothetical protein